MSDPTAKYVIGGFWLILLLAVAGFSTGVLYIKEEEPQAIETKRGDMCLQGIYPHNEVVITEHQAGEYKYEVLATSKGVEVWVQCGKI